MKKFFLTLFLVISSLNIIAVNPDAAGLLELSIHLEPYEEECMELPDNVWESICLCYDGPHSSDDGGATYAEIYKFYLRHKEVLDSLEYDEVLGSIYPDVIEKVELK